MVTTLLSDKVYKRVSSYASDRSLAVILMNLDFGLQITAMAMTFYSVRSLEVRFVDLCLIRTVLFLVGAYVLSAYHQTKESNITKRQYRQLFC